MHMVDSLRKLKALIFSLRQIDSGYYDSSKLPKHFIILFRLNVIPTGPWERVKLLNLEISG